MNNSLKYKNEATIKNTIEEKKTRLPTVYKKGKRNRTKAEYIK